MWTWILNSVHSGFNVWDAGMTPYVPVPVSLSLQDGGTLGTAHPVVCFVWLLPLLDQVKGNVQNLVHAVTMCNDTKLMLYILILVHVVQHYPLSKATLQMFAWMHRVQGAGLLSSITPIPPKMLLSLLCIYIRGYLGAAPIPYVWGGILNLPKSYLSTTIPLDVGIG